MPRSFFEMARPALIILLSGWALSQATACSSSEKSQSNLASGGSGGEVNGGAMAGGAAGDRATGGGATGGSNSSNSTAALEGGASGGSGGATTSDAGGDTAVPQGRSAGASSTNVAGTTGTAQGGSSNASSTGGSTGAALGGSTGTTSSLWTLTTVSPVLTVSFTTEDTARVIQDVPLAGGVLKTQSQDGTTFELTIPNDALISPETIAMTPVNLQSQPFGSGPAWGVQLLPDGLVFNAPLKLVITPPTGQAPAVDQQIPFGWSGTSNEVTLAYADPADSSLTLQILHFSDLKAKIQ